MDTKSMRIDATESSILAIDSLPPTNYCPPIDVIEFHRLPKENW